MILLTFMNLQVGTNTMTSSMAVFKTFPEHKEALLYRDAVIL